MIWSRLKNFECPKDKNVLQDNTFSDEYVCRKCGFHISKDRFNDIVNDIYKPRASDSYGGGSRSLDDFNSGEFDPVSEHDEFWLDPAATE